MRECLCSGKMESNDGISSVESLVLRRHAEEFERADLTPSLGVLRANYIIDEVDYQRIADPNKTTFEKSGCVLICTAIPLALIIECLRS